MIPYQFVPTVALVKGGRFFYGVAKAVSGFFPNLNLNLKKAELNVKVADYLSYCFFNDFFLFCVSWLLFFLFKPKVEVSLIPPLLVIGFTMIMLFMSQLAYPTILVQKKSVDVEMNLVAALKTLQVQLGSGVSLFQALVTLSEENYGQLSLDFKRVIHNINTGDKQIDALEKMVELSSSELLRRSMWQVINAIKTGSDIRPVLKEVIGSLTEEQIVQIQKYGAQLTPLAMFYMMLVVIIPTLSIIFLLLIGSLASISEIGLQSIFWGMLGGVVMVQYLFIGIIKSKRPVLLGG